MNVCIIGGAGYVGLITGLGLAEIGHNVVSVDVDQHRIHKLQAGQSPIYEDGLETVLLQNLAAGRLRFSTDLATAVASSDVIFIAVGTPSQQEGQADLSQVIHVAENLVRHIEEYKVIVIKSTVPVGTVELVRSILCREKQEGKDFDIVSNPEFLREGKGLHDFFCPDRIVIGACSDGARTLMRQLYSPIIERRPSNFESNEPNRLNRPHRPDKRGDVPVVEVDVISAQVIKYASNAFLAARISFINEIAVLCEKVGADIKQVTQGMGYDPRIGHGYLEAGLGFGGPCLEKDLRALIKIAEGNGHDPQLLKAVLERNERQVAEVITKLKQLTGYLLYKKIVAVFGLAFKAGTNDVRGSLALKVISSLRKEGTVVRAYDPLAISEAMEVMPEVEYCHDPYQAVSKADALLVVTEWPEFTTLDYGRIRKLMSSPVIVDTRNILDPGSLKSLGFVYRGIGRA
jgi:UDPglucose 6-dehydrogenase